MPVRHPALLAHERERSKSFQNRLADRITAFAGSMAFVWFHVVAFTVWMLLFERSPWPTLTLIVSLEAIFLATFVMISQNRADARRQVQANQTWANVHTLLQKQDEMLAILRALASEREPGPTDDKG